MTRLLISGCGGAGWNIAEVAAADGRGEIVGLVDPSERRLEVLRARYPNAVAGDSYEDILGKAKPDAVVVAGPDHLHADQTILALEHGCHALVEKPMATTVADVRRILAAEKASGCHVMADHTKRYEYPWRDTALLAKSGGLGRVFFVQGDYVHDMWPPGKGSRRPNWRADPQNPQNILLGGGCHPLDLMLWTVESPVVEVFAFASKLSAPDFPDDDCYIAAIRFQDETTGKLFVSSGCAGRGMGGGMLSVYGTEGTVWKGALHRRGEEPSELEDTSTKRLIGKLGWGGAVPEFLDLLEGKRDNPIPSGEGARGVAVCEAALESARTGQPKVPESF